MPHSVISPSITVCTPEDFDLVKKYIAEFCLDDNDLHVHQFLVAKLDKSIIGFGRLRNYSGSSELCSLGVIENYRRQGVGSALSKALITKNTSSLYTVTIIPGFFERLGFRTVTEFPYEITIKLNYCLTALSVPEEYVVMKHF
jgi:N-acetylglutamate synthase-like GNAT family acetyltransferase